MAIDSTSSLDYGFSSAGMQSLDTSLNELLYEDIKKKLDDLESSVEDQLNNCWQGLSHDRFVGDLKLYILKVENEIQKEYNNLRENMNDLSAYYLKQDDEMYVSTN